MELRILGTHNYESRDTRMAGYVIDGVLALDAGSLTRSLTFDQQSELRAVILSHRHFDHTRDVRPLGLYRWTAGGPTTDVYGIEDTIDYVRSYLLGPHSPDFTQVPSPERPVYRFHVVEFYKAFQVLDYSAVAVPVPHPVPAAGFQITGGGTELFYTGDTGVGVSAAWQRVKPDVLLIEVTFGNEEEELAHKVGHLTPALLERALADFEAERGYLPRVIVSHMNPPWEEAVRAELAELSGRIDAEIQVAEPDTTITLRSRRQ